jgi:hypothetical protein
MSESQKASKGRWNSYEEEDTCIRKGAETALVLKIVESAF